MHEAPIAQALFDAAIASLPQPTARITAFNVIAGPFSGVDPECLRFYLAELSKGTPAEGAQLVVTPAGAKITCQTCGNTENCQNASNIQFSCTKCGGPNSVTGGHELYLDSIDIE